MSDYIETGREGAALSFLDVIDDGTDLFEALSSQELQGKVRQAMGSCLDDREQQVLRLRYGLDGAAPLTQRETAQQCGVSRSYVSRIEKKALLKLRGYLETGALPEP